MSHLNAVLGAVFDALLAPARDLPPILSLSAFSLATAVAMLLVFKRTSNQARLFAVKRSIHACLFEIRLFGDDLRAIFRAQGEILRRNLTYLRLSLAPMFWMIIPLALVFGQLHFRYGYRALKPGERFIVKATLAAESRRQTQDRPAITLEAPAGLRIETPAVWIPSRGELAWRLLAERAGDHDLSVVMPDGATFRKSVRVSERLIRVSPRRVAPSFTNELLYPAERPFTSGGGLDAITVAYPDRKIDVFGIRMHWVIPYFVLSFLGAFALRKRLRVTF
ncbi:MAG: hypothetical protein JXO72_05310 [Vicinamibacteria bacterium]|nr:hypothetical protein [Vicinamibacteria bacterium]